MLLTITPNPALDRTLVIPGLEPGGVHRAKEVLVAAGGKGLNVARAARALGHHPRVCAPLCGLTGQLVARLANDEGFECYWSWNSAGETRTCILVVDPTSGHATALNEPGPAMHPVDWRVFVDTVLAAAVPSRLIAISGSLPPGIPAASFAELVRTLTSKGFRTLVDTSGPALQAVLETPPYAIKVNHHELSEATQMPIEDEAQAAKALTWLRNNGVALAVVSLGAQGALAASFAGICRAQPPALDAVSPIGSGDSLLAGLAVGLLRGSSQAEALRLGVACGSANALTVGGGVIRPDELERIFQGTTVEWVERGRAPG